MTNELSIAFALLVGVLPLFVPTIGLIPFIPASTRLARVTIAVLISYASWTLDALLIVALGIPVIIYPLLAVGTTVALLLLIPRYKPATSFQEFAPLAYLFLVTLLLVIPFLVLHGGLPTGDSQKAIFWAQDILQRPGIPQYDTADSRLNRDAVDFYTPGLHALTASVMSISPIPLMSVGAAAVASVVAVVLVAIATARELVPRLPASLLALSVGFLLLTQFRFLRYAREPGYHWQNLIGELFLFGTIFLCIRMLPRWHWLDAILALALLGSLALSHQFSTFLALFVLMPAAATLIWRAARSRRHAAHLIVLIGIGAILAMVTGGLLLNLDAKIPHIFTATPHLLDLVPSAADYLRLMGAFWFPLGVVGTLIMLLKGRSRAQRVFAATALVLLVLSQGPRLGIDIPPVRALLYSAVPLSIAGGVLFSSLLLAQHHQKRLIALILALALVVSGTLATSRAYGISHAVRTNSTLTPELLVHTQGLSAEPTGAILIDDYNKRSTSWLVLSGKPMFTRIAADIARQAAESQQSPKRQRLYFKQLQYEKIYSLGSFASIESLMKDHQISHVTGITGSSNDAFSANRILEPLSTTENVTTYGLKEETIESRCELPSESVPWLLQTATLANDIGDREDTFKHLPASIRSARVSDPEAVDGCTVRSTSASLIPLAFNVEDYVIRLWDQDNDGLFDAPLDFLLRTPGLQSSQTIVTSTGYEMSVRPGSRITIPAHEVPIEEDGFVTIHIVNSEEADIPIDLIALGISGIT